MSAQKGGPDIELGAAFAGAVVIAMFVALFVYLATSH